MGCTDGFDVCLENETYGRALGLSQAEFDRKQATTGGRSAAGSQHCIVMQHLDPLNLCCSNGLAWRSVPIAARYPTIHTASTSRTRLAVAGVL